MAIEVPNVAVCCLYDGSLSLSEYGYRRKRGDNNGKYYAVYATSPSESDRTVGNTVKDFFTHLGRASDFKDTVLPHDLPNRECAPSEDFELIWTMSDSPVILKKRTSIQKGALMSQQNADQGSWKYYLDFHLDECYKLASHYSDDFPPIIR